MKSALHALLGGLALITLSSSALTQCPGDLLLTVSEGGQEFLVQFNRYGTELLRSTGTPASANYLDQGLFLPDGDWLCLSLDGLEFFDGNSGMHTHSMAPPLACIIHEDVLQTLQVVPWWCCGMFPFGAKFVTAGGPVGLTESVKLSKVPLGRERTPKG